VTQPLALIFYQNLLPGSQLVNRLQDLNYRVQAFAEAASLIECARSEGPMLILADMDSPKEDVAGLISRLRGGSDTSHLPVVAFSASEESLPLAQQAGATLAVGETALLTHLPEVLDQVLRVD
jgi:CheY-like chemotaxis protein